MPELLLIARLVSRLRRKHLDGHFASHHGVVGPIDRAYAGPAEHFVQPVSSEDLTVHPQPP